MTLERFVEIVDEILQKHDTIDDGVGRCRIKIFTRGNRCSECYLSERCGPESNSEHELTMKTVNDYKKKMKIKEILK